MRIAVVFGMNQIISHGFGVFLFAAVVPLMRDSIAISHWQLAAIGALTQFAYVGGALLVGVLGHRVGSERLALISGGVSSGLLLLMAGVQNVVLVTLILACLAASAAISWGSIVGILSHYVERARQSTNLSVVCSGTAWGYGLNGLLILLVVPLSGWRLSWLLAGVFGVLVVVLTWRLLRRLPDRSSATEEHGSDGIPARLLLKVIISERTALFSCVLSLLAGFITLPFASWLNIYLDARGLEADLGGFTWFVAGGTGMFAGYLTGKLADRRGHGMALMVIFVGYAVSLLAFVVDPARFALLAGFGYGLMYFPVWGILAGWVSQRYSPVSSMQISGLCMLMAGLGGALGNLLAGAVYQATGALSGVFLILACVAVVPVLLVFFITRGVPDPALQGASEVAPALR